MSGIEITWENVLSDVTDLNKGEYIRSYSELLSKLEVYPDSEDYDAIVEDKLQKNGYVHRATKSGGLVTVIAPRMWHLNICEDDDLNRRTYTVLNKANRMKMRGVLEDYNDKGLPTKINSTISFNWGAAPALYIKNVRLDHRFILLFDSDVNLRQFGYVYDWSDWLNPASIISCILGAFSGTLLWVMLHG